MVMYLAHAESLLIIQRSPVLRTVHSCGLSRVEGLEQKQRKPVVTDVHLIHNYGSWKFHWMVDTTNSEIAISNKCV